jgi:hypothetical protein
MLWLGSTSRLNMVERFKEWEAINTDVIVYVAALEGQLELGGRCGAQFQGSIMGSLES